MGSILVGSKEVIYRARRARKLFGGAMRQAGILAASAVYALENNVERLAVDHQNAQMFAEEIRKIPGISLDASGVPTNLVYFEVDPKLGNASQLSYALKERGVLINAGGKVRLRACTHLDASKDDLLAAAKVLAECVRAGFSTFPGTAAGPYVRG